MADFTSLYAQIWQWRRWRMLDESTRLLWLGLYTTLHAKRLVPGLWHGSVAIMSEETGISPEACIRGIDTLLERDLVEYDRDTRVLRMTEMPDAGEAPANDKWVRGWWNRFLTVPACPIRDAHVKTLRWILDEGARRRGKMIPQSMETAWLETFGTVEIPANRRRGITRLEGDNDTSTSFQPSLFSPRPEPLQSAPIPMPMGQTQGSDRNPHDESSESSSAPKASNKTRSSAANGSGGSGVAMGIAMGSDTHVHGSGTGTGTGPDFFFSDLRGGSGELSTAPPHLLLVPPPGAFPPDELAQLFKGSPYWPPVLAEAQRFDLGHAIAQLGDLAAGRDVLALLRARCASGTWAAWRDLYRGGPDALAAPGRLTQLVQEVIAWQRDSDARRAALREVLGEHGM